MLKWVEEREKGSPNWHLFLSPFYLLSAIRHVTKTQENGIIIATWYIQKTWLIVAFEKNSISCSSFTTTVHDTWCCHFMLLISIFTSKGIICSLYTVPPSVFTVASYNKNIIISSIFTLFSLFPFTVFDSLIITFV